jgi:hypothetical protein
MHAVTRINMAGLSDGQQRVVAIVDRDGFLINYGEGEYATAAGRKVPHASVRALLRRAYLRPNDDVLQDGRTA